MNELVRVQVNDNQEQVHEERLGIQKQYHPHIPICSETNSECHLRYITFPSGIFFHLSKVHSKNTYSRFNQISTPKPL